jgi:hypothetical protein
MFRLEGLAIIRLELQEYKEQDFYNYVSFFPLFMFLWFKPDDGLTLLAETCSLFLNEYML